MRTRAEPIEADRRHVWHPFTQQQNWCDDGEEPLVIDHGAGTNLYDVEGNEYIDGSRRSGATSTATGIRPSTARSGPSWTGWRTPPCSACRTSRRSSWPSG